MQIWRHGEGLGNLVTCSGVRRIRRKTHGSNCLTVLFHNWSVHKTQQWGQTVLTCGVQWVYHGINKSSYIYWLCVFSTGRFTPPYLSKLPSIAMWRLVWDDTVYVPTQSCQKYIPSLSLNTDYLIPCLLVLFSLDAYSLHGVVCMQKFGELNFVETGLKSKFGVNPQFFSHELCHAHNEILNEFWGYAPPC